MEAELLQDIITYLNDEYNDEQDGVLLLFIKNAINEVCNRRYPFGYTEQQKESALQKYRNVIFNIAVYLYSKQGAEGENSHSESGTSRGYESAGIPESYLISVTPMAKLI